MLSQKAFLMDYEKELLMVNRMELLMAQQTDY